MAQEGPKSWGYSPGQDAKSFTTNWRACNPKSSYLGPGGPCTWGRLIYSAHEVQWSEPQTSCPYHVSSSVPRVSFLAVPQFPHLGLLLEVIISLKTMMLVMVPAGYTGYTARKALIELRMGRCCPVPCLGWAAPAQKNLSAPWKEAECWRWHSRIGWESCHPTAI